MSKKGKAEPKASELLPADGPTPVDPTTVMRADDPLHAPVETRKIGIRRVSCLEFGNRMFDRVRRRSAGNTRRFWMKIEADDPFLVAPSRPTDAVLEIYPTQRLDRTQGSLPKPQPDVAKAYPPRHTRDDDAPPPRPRSEIKRDPKAPKAPKAPEVKHTPDPRPAPTPQTAQESRRDADREEKDRRILEQQRQARDAEKARPLPPPEPVPPPRHLPPKTASSSGRTSVGRQRMPSRAAAAAPAPTAVPEAVDPDAGKSAAEIREERRRVRAGEGEKEKPKSLDTYREFMQNMMFLRDKFDAGEEIPDIVDTSVVKEAPPKPKAPKGEVKRESKEVKRTPKVEKAPEPAPPPIDRRPPMPKKEAPKEIDRSPKGGGSGGLDDLFGGGGDRVRIPKSKKNKPDDEDKG